MDSVDSIPEGYTVPVRVMSRDWQASTVYRHNRMSPYQRRPARFENVCGQFVCKVHFPAVASAIVSTHNCFGGQRELYHLDGSVALTGHTATYKGCRGYDSIARLARAMSLHGAESRVHMAVLSGTTGSAAEVRQQGYLEINLWPCVCSGQVKIDVPFEQTNSLRMSIKKFEGPFALPEELQPATNDWTVTLRGAVVARMTWPGLVWSSETERTLAEFADRVVIMLGECCK